MEECRVVTPEVAGSKPVSHAKGAPTLEVRLGCNPVASAEPRWIVSCAGRISTDHARSSDGTSRSSTVGGCSLRVDDMRAERYLRRWRHFQLNQAGRRILSFAILMEQSRIIASNGALTCIPERRLSGRSIMEHGCTYGIVRSRPSGRSRLQPAISTAVVALIRGSKCLLRALTDVLAR